MPSFYLNSYTPLVSTEQGRKARKRYAIPPFVDGSIRREPDLEHRYPGISCLCRGSNFAPRLEVGDVVAYVTNKRDLGNGKERRLTAVLRVWKIFDTHAAAAEWYREHGLLLPSNCMVPDNRPKPFAQSHGRDSGANGCNGWDAAYWERARRWGTFVVCRPLWRKLGESARVVEDDHLKKAFRRVPCLQNPGRMSMQELRRFVKEMRLPIRVSSG
jgi:hypothetical protein